MATMNSGLLPDHQIVMNSCSGQQVPFGSQRPAAPASVALPCSRPAEHLLERAVGQRSGPPAAAVRLGTNAIICGPLPRLPGEAVVSSLSAGMGLPAAELRGCVLPPTHLSFHHPSVFLSHGSSQQTQVTLPQCSCPCSDAVPWEAVAGATPAPRLAAQPVRCTAPAAPAA